MKIVVVGGGAAGIGAAGAARGTDKNAEVVVYTEYEDAAYSPCGIPYVHGKEIPDFQALFLATKESYTEAGIDIRYETAVTAFAVILVVALAAATPVLISMQRRGRHA